MFDHDHYVPILKGKRGEFRALAKLEPGIKKRVTPFIDVPLPGLEFSDEYPTGKPKEDLRSHLIGISTNIQKFWGVDQGIFVDLFEIDLDSRIDGRHYLEFIFSDLKRMGVKAIPVTGFDRDDSYQAALAQLPISQYGVCLRLLPEDIEDAKACRQSLESLLATLRLDKKQIDLLLDARSLQEDRVPELLAQIGSFLLDWNADLPLFRTVILAGSSFPQSMAGITTSSVTRLRRLELDVWRAIRRIKGLLRQPTFSDYGIVHPDSVSLDFRKVTLGGKIRYTVKNEWLVFRGGSFKKTPHAVQFRTLATKLADHDEFEGPDFSYGDECVVECSQGKSPQAGLESWVRNDTNHHITFVVNQIAKLSSS